MACQQVAEEFRIVDPAKLQFPVTVVLGEASRYTADEDAQVTPFTWSVGTTSASFLPS
jgi:hypothetical protein